MLLTLNVSKRDKIKLNQKDRRTRIYHRVSLLRRIHIGYYYHSPIMNNKAEVEIDKYFIDFLNETTIKYLNYNNSEDIFEVILK